MQLGDEWKAKEDELLKSATRAYNDALRLDAFLNYDSTGVGAGVGAKVNEQRKRKTVKHGKFVAGGGVFEPEKIYTDKITNKDFFANLKAQSWWLVADKFRLTYQVIQAMKEWHRSSKIQT